MRTGIHPEYKVGTVTCACGNTFQVRTTVGDLRVEICSACHPFFTGKQKLVDSAGRVEKFNRKYGRSGDAKAQEAAAKTSTSAAADASKEEATKEEAAKS